VGRTAGEEPCKGTSRSRRPAVLPTLPAALHPSRMIHMPPRAFAKFY